MRSQVLRSKLLLGMGVLACSLSGAALADPDPMRPIPSGASVRGTPIRIEASLSVQIPLAPGSAIEEQVRQTEAARKAVYGMAARECTALKEVFKAECRLVSLRANSNVQPRGNGTEQVFVSGSGSYELTERP
ncbi:hypothetical protein [uncultured Methylobacterium sp.]|uniref:hypothetical protein n=1 Tax=uncultured Methylobacterium sp. TaxID=157278 RepID=UPI0035CB9093